jgi:uncharacterized repeat protein (TIGR01451 family)
MEKLTARDRSFVEKRYIANWNRSFHKQFSVPLVHLHSDAAMTRTLRLTLALLTLLAVAPAQAQQRKGGPTLLVAASNTTASAESAKGRSAVRPNDVLRYTLTFSNPTERPVANVELRNPIPEGVVFVPGSAKASRPDARLEFSADNGKSWAAQPMESVTVAGQPVTRAIPVNRYTHIRWVVKSAVQPKGVITAEFDAKVGGAGA